MGIILSFVVVYHIPMSNLEQQNFKTCGKYGHSVISLFPHLIRGTNGCHHSSLFKCTTIHNKPLTSRIRWYCTLTIKMFLFGEKTLPFTTKYEFTFSVTIVLSISLSTTSLACFILLMTTFPPTPS